MAPLLGLNVSLASPVQLDASIAGVAAMRSQLCASLTNSRSDALLIGGEFFTGTQWHELMGTTRVRCRAYGYGYASTPFKLIHSQTSQLLRGGRPAEPRAVTVLRLRQRDYQPHRLPPSQMARFMPRALRRNRRPMAAHGP